MANRLFIPAKIDDYGFDPFEFRILARIYRRCLGRNSRIGVCFESVSQMSQKLQISVSIVRRTLNILEKAQVIEREWRTGSTSVIRFVDLDYWPSIEDFREIRKQFTPTQSSRGKQASWLTNGVETEDKNGGGGMSFLEGDRSDLEGVGLSETTPEGLPSEGLPSEGHPKKVIPLPSQPDRRIKSSSPFIDMPIREIRKRFRPSIVDIQNTEDVK